VNRQHDPTLSSALLASIAAAARGGSASTSDDGGACTGRVRRSGVCRRVVAT
jgi:hypothetical protein